MFRFLIFLVSLAAPVAIQMAATGSTFTAANASASINPMSSRSSAGSLLPADRNASANWQKAGMLALGGIPNRTTVCSTVNPLGSHRDDTVNIQNAISNCPLGQVVSLAAGTFTIAEGEYVMLNKGITLRGAGAGVTTLQRTNGARLGSYQPGSKPSPIIIVGPMRWNNNLTATSLIADAAAGTNSVKVASTAGFSVGQIVLLDEASGAGWQRDVEGLGQIWASPDYRVVWQKHNPSQSWDDFSSTSYPYQSGTAGCWFSSCDRPTNEIKQISAISGNTITFDSPVTISYRVSHQAQLHYWQTPHTRNAGIENMTLEGGDNGNLRFEWAAYCWAQNVESTLWLGEGFAIDSSFRIQLEEFYAHAPVWPVPGGGGYNISLSNGSSEILIENGISVLANKVMVSRSSGAGSVVAYNYMDDGFISGQGAWQEIGLNASHMVGSHHMLFEGNYGFNMDSDTTHGNSIYQTFFRNYATGYRSRFIDYINHNSVVDDINDFPGRNGPLRAAGAQVYSYWFSFIGNVLGTPGHTSGWSYNGSFTNGTPAIWGLGWDNLPNQLDDPNVANTTIRDANFDYLTNTVVWAANDTAHTLPNSLYLTRKPAFFNVGRGYIWPWVNPTGSPQLYTLPAKVRYDAGTPFKQP
jgi:Pectate lyase superfamily protein